LDLSTLRNLFAAPLVPLPPPPVAMKIVGPLHPDQPVGDQGVHGRVASPPPRSHKVKLPSKPPHPPKRHRACRLRRHAHANIEHGSLLALRPPQCGYWSQLEAAGDARNPSARAELTGLSSTG